MHREIYGELLKWKDDAYRKPLVIKGARQVGKTYIVTAFGKNEFKNMITLNCDKDRRIRELFSRDFRTDRIISGIEIISGQKVRAKETLIFIDEIGDAPEALASLKYFCEDCPQYHIIVAGSLLGLSIHEGTSYPVGKTDELTLYPFSFSEFLTARHDMKAADYLKNGDLNDLCSMKSFYEEALREFYFTGGMPEVIQGLIDGRAYDELRNIQKKILSDYALDISKHAPSSILGRIHQVWNSIPQQLAKSNKKFIYGDIQKGARAKDFELAIQWLIDAGVVYKIPRVRKIGIPLRFYEDFSGFKLFLLDHGLMGAMVDAPVSSILLSQNVFEEYKGIFTEQYVLEELFSIGADVFYYDSDTSKLELDFLIQSGDKLIPIEVKAAENLKSKSLRQIKLDNPDCVPVRFSMSDYRVQEWMVNLSLYMVCRLKDVI